MDRNEGSGSGGQNPKAWSFWESIGNPTFVVAPMVDQSDLPFRRYGAQLTYTPMLHAKCVRLTRRIFSENENYRKIHFHTSADDRPLIAQFCAASFIKDEVAAVDINLGCPQGIARKGMYGSFLLEYPELVT